MVDFKELRALATAIPFTPFVVELSDGQQFAVTRRYQFGIDPTDYYFIYTDDVSGQTHRIAASRIVSRSLVGKKAAS
jgi:hypothetical protein